MSYWDGCKSLNNIMSAETEAVTQRSSDLDSLTISCVVTATTLPNIELDNVHNLYTLSIIVLD